MSHIGSPSHLPTGTSPMHRIQSGVTKNGGRALFQRSANPGGRQRSNCVSGKLRSSTLRGMQSTSPLWSHLMRACRYSRLRHGSCVSDPDWGCSWVNPLRMGVCQDCAPVSRFPWITWGTARCCLKLGTYARHNDLRNRFATLFGDRAESGAGGQSTWHLFATS